MITFLQRILLVMVLSAFSACRKETAETTAETTTPTIVVAIAPQPTASRPPRVTVDRFGRSAEPGPIREAVNVQEVSFMVRMHEPDAEILGQVQRRGLAEPIDDQVTATLVGQGASAPLLAQLKASPFLLTPPEQELYANRAKRLKWAGEAARSEQDAAIASNRDQLNQRIRAADRQQNANRLSADRARVKELEKKLEKERYSTNSLSPYQGVARDLEQARERAKATSNELVR